MVSNILLHPFREPQESSDLKRLSNLPTTDMDSELLMLTKPATVLENPSGTGPPVSPRQPKQTCADDPFYDSVPQEENISYIDG